MHFSFYFCLDIVLICENFLQLLVECYFYDQLPQMKHYYCQTIGLVSNYEIEFVNLGAYYLAVSFCFNFLRLASSAPNSLR